MASTAIYMPEPPLGAFDGDDLPAFVIAAMRADAMRQLRLAALRAHRAGRRGQLVVRPALAAAGLGMSSFRQRHDSPLWSFVMESRGQVLERGQARIGRSFRAGAGDEIAIAAAHGAKAPAVLAAERLHRQRERRLALHETRQIDLVVIV